MIRTKLFTACALAFVVSLAGTSAAAQEPVNQLTYFTFSAPFELPGGKTLPAGKYVFRVMDSPSNRHIIHVMSEDEREMHATLMAIPAQRMEAADEPEVRFMEADANAAPAIRTWWYPGRTIGHEFIYPKDHARRLAARQSEGVLTVSADESSDEQMRTGDLSRVGADGREAALEAEMTAENAQAQASREQATADTTTAQTTPAQTTRADTTTAQTTPTTQAPAPAPERDTTPAADTAATDRPARTELPRTASPLPIFALIGLGSLVGAGVLRLRRR